MGGVERGESEVTVRAGVIAGREVDQDQGHQDQGAENLDPDLNQDPDQNQDPNQDQDQDQDTSQALDQGVGQDQDQDQPDRGRGLAQPNPSQALPPDLDQAPGQGLRLLALEHALVQLLPEQDQDQQDPELDQAPDQDLVHLQDLGQDLPSQDPHHLQDPS